MNLRAVNILLVDDSPADAELTLFTLKRIGFCNPVHHELHADAALAWLEATPTLPDLILLDINMPGMSGLEFLGVIKAQDRYAPIPVVVFTSSGRRGDIEEAYRNHCAGYIKKPLDVAELGEALSGLGRYWFALVERPRSSDTPAQ